MPARPHDTSLLNDPVAQMLLHSRIPARVAYVWHDGTPRLISLVFFWNGEELVFATPSNAPKSGILKDGTKVAVLIDTDEMPYKVLSIRGPASVREHEGVVSEYADACRRYMGNEGGNAWVAQVDQMLGHPKMGGKMIRITVKPEWVHIMDFEQRFPSAIEAVMTG